jgi:hypothetical protein
MVETTIRELDGRLLARIEDESMVFEVNADTVAVRDVTLHFLRDGERVGSIYNDHGTEKTMAHLDTSGNDFIGVEVPKSFVASVLDAAAEQGRLDESAASAAGYRTRVLKD